MVFVGFFFRSNSSCSPLSRKLFFREKSVFNIPFRYMIQRLRWSQEFLHCRLVFWKKYCFQYSTFIRIQIETNSLQGRCGMDWTLGEAFFETKTVAVIWSSAFIVAFV